MATARNNNIFYSGKFIFMHGKLKMFVLFFCSLLSSIFIFVIRMNDIPLMENYFDIRIVDMCGLYFSIVWHTFSLLFAYIDGNTVEG